MVQTVKIVLVPLLPLRILLPPCICGSVIAGENYKYCPQQSLVAWYILTTTTLPHMHDGV